MTKYKRKAVKVTMRQDAFLKRKVASMRKRVPRGKENTVNESTVLQGLIDYWMTEDSRKAQ